MKCFVSATQRISTSSTRFTKGFVFTVSDEASKVSSYDAVPCRALSLVKLVVFSTDPTSWQTARGETHCFLDVLCNVLLDRELSHRLLRWRHMSDMYFACVWEFHALAYQYRWPPAANLRPTGYQYPNWLVFYGASGSLTISADLICAVAQKEVVLARNVPMLSTIDVVGELMW